MSSNISFLRCEYAEQPLAIDCLQPRLSWLVGQGDQEAYAIEVASSREALLAGEADLWQSGRIAGNACSQIAYAGQALRSYMQCWWRVQIWCDGQAGAWSDPAMWCMGRPSSGWAKRSALVCLSK